MKFGELFRRAVMVGVSVVCGMNLPALPFFQWFLYGFAGLVVLVTVGELVLAQRKRRERRRQEDCGPEG